MDLTAHPVTDSSGRQGKNSAMATKQAETERTFEVPRRWSCPSTVGTGGVTRVEGPRRFTQTATYLDTPALTLLRHRRTLRRRVGGIDAGWHLKLPRSGDTRTEMHEPLGNSAARVPVSLRAAVTDIIGSEPVVPVAILRTRRTRRELLDADGALVAEIVDDSVEATVLLDGERIIRWREVELELGPAGDLDTLDALTCVLEASRLIRSTNPSKLGRALAEPLARRDPDTTGREVTAGEVVMTYVGTQLGVIQATEPAVREDTADAVHRMRVATRRTRSTLKTYRDLFDPTVVDDLRHELSWLADCLGVPRDAEVLLARATALLDDLDPSLIVGPVRQRLLGMLREDHTEGRRRLNTALDSRRYERLLTDLAEFVQTPPYLGELAHTPAPDTVLALTGRAAGKVIRTAREAEAAEPPERDIAIHDVRKKAKVARYADEAATPVRQGKGAARAWTAVQEALGDHQDGVVAVEAYLRAARAARTAGEDTFTYGVLVERENAAARAIQDGYGDLLHAALKRAKAVQR